MKKLIRTIEVHELRAKRALFLRKARALEAEAMKFRRDAAEAGCELTNLGEPIYTGHPLYQDMVYPLIKRARHNCVVFGFDLMFQTRTPLPGSPDFTHAIVGIIDEPTPTMAGCLELIQKRPSITMNPDGTVSEYHHTPEISVDNDDKQKASE